MEKNAMNSTPCDDRSAIEAAHKLMVDGVSKMTFPSDGIDNRDDENERNLIRRWADYGNLEKDLQKHEAR